MTLTDLTEITAPGVYDDLDEATYHADPVPGGSLSNSGAKTILRAPALYRHQAEHGRPDKPEFEYGRAAHSLVLGIGQTLVEVDGFKDWRTQAAQAKAAEIRADGGIPLLSPQMRTVEDMATALHRHPLAARLLDVEHGRPEVSMFRQVDTDHGPVMLRSRVDWLPNPHDGRMVLPDYKTIKEGGADPETFRRDAAKHHYPMQAAFYSDMVIALGLAERVSFVFVVQEKTAPYLVSVIELDAPSIAAGRRNYQRAVARYAECKATGVWPSYTDDVALVGVPSWYLYDSEDFAA